MHRHVHRAISLGLGLVLLSSAWAIPAVQAGGENPDEGSYNVEREGDDDFGASRIEGRVYEIRQIESSQVVTIYVVDIGQGVDVYVKTAPLQNLIKNNTVCVGRYVIAEGVRTGPGTLDAEGLQADPTTACGTPPK